MHKLCNKGWYNKQTIIQLLPHSSLSKFISSNKNASKLKRGCLVSVLLEQMWKGILSHTHTPTSIVSAQDTQFLEIYTFLVPWIIWYYLNTGKWLILLTPCWKTAKPFYFIIPNCIYQHNTSHSNSEWPSVTLDTKTNWEHDCGAEHCCSQVTTSCQKPRLTRLWHDCWCWCSRHSACVTQRLVREAP